MKAEVEILDTATNAVVLQLPSRRYPGVLMQGDSLALLAASARRALTALDASDVGTASEELREVCERLDAYQTRYETALSAAGRDLPYRK